MFCINVALGATSWRLLYRDEENAKHALGIYHDTKHLSEIRLEDDFGQKLTAPSSAIHGVMFEDLDKTKLAHIEMALHQARTQNAAQAAAQADPTLRNARQNMGPAIISPMGNGVRPM